MPHKRRTPRATAVALVTATLVAATLITAVTAADVEHHAHPSPPAGTGTAERQLVDIPDAVLVDQDGRAVNLRDLVAGRRVAINFIFTTCTTVCPPMGALFARLQRELEARGDGDVVFLSISIDPARDTPERMSAWARRFNGSDRWRLLTGEKPVFDQVLKDLGVFSALIAEHAPLMLLGDEGSGTWIRASGLAPPAELIRTLDELPRPAIETPGSAAARDYFTDTLLVDQDGQTHRFYSDLVAGKTVVIHPFFATCTGSCPVMHKALAKAQAAIGERLGRDVFFLSITVDPEHDTPERLRAWADAFGARPGWSFLTGEKADVDRVLARLGQETPQKEAHQAIFLVGNDRTGLWQKTFGLGPADDLIAVVKSVADDSATPRTNEPLPAP